MLSGANYCLKCSGALEMQPAGERLRPVCTSCGWIYYAQLKLGAGVLLEKDGALLLMRRKNEPWQGAWNIPAGYVEADEKPQEAARREAWEETGLLVRIGDLVDVYHFCDDPRGDGLLLVYRAEITGGELVETEEACSPAFFFPIDIPGDLAGGGHDQAILAWKAAWKAAWVADHAD
jgi:ADP-ribose pyrophosphatase YjhB (NUDIX family)